MSILLFSSGAPAGAGTDETATGSRWSAIVTCITIKSMQVIGRQLSELSHYMPVYLLQVQVKVTLQLMARAVAGGIVIGSYHVTKYKVHLNIIH